MNDLETLRAALIPGEPAQDVVDRSRHRLQNRMLAAPRRRVRPFEHIAFTVPYNMSGQPAVSVNCGYTDDGRPIGLQISGRRFDDVGVLRAAAAYEGLREPQRPWPIG